MREERSRRIEAALFRGGSLTVENTVYRRAVEGLFGLLLDADLAGGDLTTAALEFESTRGLAVIVAREFGVVAGLAELVLVFESRGLRAKPEKSDGDLVEPGDRLLSVEGAHSDLLALERVGLNLLQRLSGIASASRRLDSCLRRYGSSARVVGTRKTPWGLLDKRALHLGGCGTHRLGLGDSILVKNNHLARFSHREDEAVPLAIERAWKHRSQSGFLEVEVRSEAAARRAAETFCRLLEAEGASYPCLLLLDNLNAAQAGAVVALLRSEGLWDATLLEASGGITESNLRAFSASGVDAISVGALTHSARALDFGQTLS